MKTVNKILGVICYVIAILSLLFGLAAFAMKEAGVGIFFAVIAVIFVLLARYTKSYATKKYGTADPVPAPTAPAPEAPAPAPSTPRRTRERRPVPKYKPAENCESYNFDVAGTHYRQDDIEELMDDNPEYGYTKKEIKENALEDTRLYKYSIAVINADLVPEPDNPHDPNAIKVMADGVLVGYVPAAETETVRQLTSEKEIVKIQCSIYGGEYKFLSYDDSTIRKGSTDLKAVVSIKYK